MLSADRLLAEQLNWFHSFIWRIFFLTIFLVFFHKLSLFIACEGDSTRQMQ